ncbi:MAG: hypothetical protein EXQ94_04400 [Alphaproteobacteria bacterium]|nr:hypothetical protein [Alphaproteobacteria bacterium]
MGSHDAVARLITVGPAGEYGTIREAADAAKDGDVVEIAAGTYTGDVATWTANDLTIRGVGGRPVLDAAGQSVGGKAIWVITGNNVLVDNIAFINATVSDQNGAGIRYEGGLLTVRNSVFKDNEEGILTNNVASMVLIVESSVFQDNGVAGDGGGKVHGIYAGNIGEVVVRGSLFIGTKIGHHLKSRALKTTALCNRFEDGPEGTASFAIDLPDGGDALIMGNVFHQGMLADNSHTIAYGNESLSNPGRTLIIIFNTFVDDLNKAELIRVPEGEPVRVHVSNNIFVGKTPFITQGSPTDPNLRVGPSNGQDQGVLDSVQDLFGFAESESFAVTLTEDYHLVAGSKAIDAGVDNVALDAEVIVPQCEYVEPASERPRSKVGALDVGAFEFEGP